jgi:alkaline phosphatase
MKHAPLAAVPIALGLAFSANAAPHITRLTPPSELFSSGRERPLVARFLPGQRFDLQCTVVPDAGRQIGKVEFLVDGKVLRIGVYGETRRGLKPDLPEGTIIASLRGVSVERPGIHRLTVRARQDDGLGETANGNFEVLAIPAGRRGARRIIFMLGDGMGAAQRTAARIMASGYAQGKALAPLAMDTLPYTAMVMTASHNSIVTDSAPGMSSYATGNKSDNGQEGVFADDTLDPFDNPRVEFLSEYLHRRFGTSTGLVTTADVSDATPAANAVHTADRRAGTGIVDQYLDDRALTGLAVLMGGGRKWFTPNPTDKIVPLTESQRTSETDYQLPPELARAWGSAIGVRDSERNLLADFTRQGFVYLDSAANLQKLPPATEKMLGLFSLSNMSVSFDKIHGRRGLSSIAADNAPDQPLLEEMLQKALSVLAKNPRGFYLLAEGASIDKQAHAMDTERTVFEVIEFDRAVRVARDFVARHPDTLLIVSADHETGGMAIIGASRLSAAEMQTRAATPGIGAGSGKTPGLRAGLVGTYERAGFPQYTLAGDGFPDRVDIDHKLLMGYGANPDRYEDWLANEKPMLDAQHPFAATLAAKGYPKTFFERDMTGGFLITGQIEDDVAAHTGTDIPLSAYGRGAGLFHGVLDNTDVFFKMAEAIAGAKR